MADSAAIDRNLEGLRIDRSQRQVPRKTNVSRVLILVGITVLVVIAIWRIWGMLTGVPEVDVHRVVVPTAGSSGSSIVLQAAGYVVPHYRIEVASKVVGRVAWMGVEKGDKVQSGQDIVRLEDQEYRARLQESIGTLNSRKARLMELQAGSRPEEIQRAEFNLLEQQALLKQARIDFGRAQELSKDGVIAKAEFDQAQNSLEALESRVESLANTLTLLQLGPRQEEIDFALAEVNRAEGTVTYNDTIVDATIIRAPVTGTVLERNVEVGELVTTGFVGERGAKGYVIAMADLDDIQVELDISQDDFARIFMRQETTVATDAYRDRSYQGQVVEISPEADRQKATVQVKVQILEPDEFIRPEMNANVAFLADSRNQTQESASSNPRVRIPSDALVNGNLVFLLIENKAVSKTVHVVRSIGSIVEIDQGLSGGEEVILSPPEELENGDKVQRKAS